MKPLLILATMLGGTGATAVEGHFFQILREAPAREWDTLLLTPNTGRRLRRAPFRLFKNIPYEWGRVIYRNIQAKLLESQIRFALARHPGRQITIYSQCPQSGAPLDGIPGARLVAAGARSRGTNGGVDSRSMKAANRPNPISTKGAAACAAFQMTLAITGQPVVCAEPPAPFTSGRLAKIALRFCTPTLHHGW